MSTRHYSLIDDLPLNQAHEFNFDRIVDTLYHFITNAQNLTPLNICIDGSWGAGKTSLMKTLQQRLALEALQERRQDSTASQYIPMWFEPWKLTDETEVLNSLVNLVLRRIQDDAGFIASAQIEVNRRDAMRVLSQRFLEVNPDELSTYYQWSARLKGSFVEIEDLFRKITAAYLESERRRRRFVIFVDDLDRCPPPRIVAVLETVKLFFNMPGFLFIFGMDRAQIHQSIRKSYEGFGDVEAKVYLEKMFQLTYSLPAKEEDSLVAFVSRAMQDMGLRVQNRALLQVLVETFGRNLRNLKLFLNNFNFQRHIIAGQTSALTDEVLFKWLYVETMLPASMDAATKQRSLGLLVALEFLAQGALLDDPLRYNNYRNFLVQDRIPHLPLIVWALLPQGDDNEEIDDKRLNPEQKQIVNALRRDGAVLQTLQVLREGESFFLDQDLAALAYLTRRETLMQESSLGASPTVGGTLAEFEGNFVLSKSSWSSMGDKFTYKKQEHKFAYFAYLLALLLDFGSATYWADLGATYRKLGYRDAALAILKRGYEVDPSDVNVSLQHAYLYDSDDDDEHASLLYRKAIALGSLLASTRYNAALNLKGLGDVERAFYFALEAYCLEPTDDKKRKRAREYASLVGKETLDFENWGDELANELKDAKVRGLIPYSLSGDEEQTIASMMSSYVKCRPDSATHDRVVFTSDVHLGVDQLASVAAG